MNMQNNKIMRLLGTGANDWKANHACNAICKDRCARARKLGGKNIRRYCALFIAPDTVIDFTGDTVKALHAYGIDEKAIGNVIITHGHADHFQPMEILKLATRRPRPLTVYGNVMVKAALDFVCHNRWDKSNGIFKKTDKRTNIQVRTVFPDTSFSAGGVKITPILANHMIDKTYSILEQPALNYVVEWKNKVLFYGLDSSYVLPRSFDVLRRYRFDIAVFDATFGHMAIDPAKSGHHNFAMLKKTLAQFRRAKLFRKDALIIASHISRCYVDPYDDIVHALAHAGITLAYDGMIISPPDAVRADRLRGYQRSRQEAYTV